MLVTFFFIEFCREFYKSQNKTWEKFVKKANECSFKENPTDIDAVEVLRAWYLNQDSYRGMIELSYSIKEIFCDLFMCALYHLTFKEYIALFNMFKAKLQKAILEDDMTLAYRIITVCSVLRSEYDFEKISITITNEELRLIEDTLTIQDGNNNEHIKRLTRKIADVCVSSRTCVAIINTLRNEIIFLRENREQFSKINDQNVSDIIRPIMNPDSKDSSKRFSKQIDIMKTFMNYDETRTEGVYTEIKVPHFSLIRAENKAETVTSLPEYIDRIISISEGSNVKMWYRGVCNSEYSLLPSIFRNLDKNLSLYANQVNYLKLAYEATLAYPNMWTEGIQEQISLLQHYGMPTSLLDFSLNMLTALHFALNPDYPEDKKALDLGQYTPVVYIFNPVEYANAIITLKTHKVTHSEYNISPVLYEIAKDDMSKYFPKDMGADKLIQHSDDHTKPTEIKNESIEYPVPIIVRQSNDRVRIQGGTFVAYSLNSDPDKNHPTEEQDIGPYSYLDLKRIEKEYEEIQKKKKCSPIRKFLHEVRISPWAYKSIHSDVEAFGITKSSVYPELHHIFEEARKKKPGITYR